ncbi:MAG: SpoIID/LytB domain-containing protein [Candidatus Omnitrophica bacterium]|nr:SpoIID/LytB domain-containing protein [Candidatus Omnitrophota bacterium]
MIRKLSFLIYLSAILISAYASAEDISVGASPATNAGSYPVRVAVITDALEVNLKIKSHYNIYALPLLEPLGEGDELKKVVIKPTQSGILIGSEPFDVYGVRIKTGGGADMYVNGRRFRGDIDIIRTEKIKLLVINHLDVEDYISGVLYHEVSHLWPMEALKAQAIASRTFAVYKTIESVGKDYDLSNDIYSQVYGGRTSVKYRTNRAVRETRGKILVYRDKVLPAYFHAACGGHTEDASLLWNVNIAPLKGRSCNYCTQSPHFRWTASMTLADIETKLIDSGYKINGIKNIEVSAKNASGRADSVNVISLLGQEKVPANKFRLAVGPNILRSTNFEVTVRGKTAIFNGRGWGHGVGMCQWGAYYMSKKGFSAKDILQFYYPGAAIADMQYLMVERNE